MTAPYNVHAKRGGEECQELWPSAVKALVCVERLGEQGWTDVTVSDAHGNRVSAEMMQRRAADEATTG